jgi:hypothetical protein
LIAIGQQRGAHQPTGLRLHPQVRQAVRGPYNPRIVAEFDRLAGQRFRDPQLQSSARGSAPGTAARLIAGIGRTVRPTGYNGAGAAERRDGMECATSESSPGKEKHMSAN